MILRDGFSIISFRSMEASVFVYLQVPLANRNGEGNEDVTKSKGDLLGATIAQHERFRPLYFSKLSWANNNVKSP